MGDCECFQKLLELLQKYVPSFVMIKATININTPTRIVEYTSYAILIPQRQELILIPTMGIGKYIIPFWYLK